MNAALDIHTPLALENFDLLRLQNAIAERQLQADAARNIVTSIEAALVELAAVVRRAEILAGAGFPVNVRDAENHAGLQQRLATQRDTLAHWESLIGELGACADNIALSPLDTIAGKILRKSPNKLTRAERGVSLKMPEGPKGARLRLFDGREIEF